MNWIKVRSCSRMLNKRQLIASRIIVKSFLLRELLSDRVEVLVEEPCLLEQ